MQSSEHFHAVILAGGGGTRLWPKSRQKFPKHLVNIVGKETIIKLTYNRIKPLFPNERILVITNHAQVDLVKAQLPEIPEKNIIAEPLSKNTALAMGVAAAFVQKRDPDAVMIYLAADQMIEDEEIFRKTVNTALNVASQGEYIVGIGIRPTFPHTGLGYIRIGGQLEFDGVGKDGIYAFQSRGFKEKPDLVTAQSFLATGQYLWNANLYCWKPQTLFYAFEKYSPEIGENVKKLLSAIGTKEEKQVLQGVYQSSKNVQIDYAVSEKANNIVVIPGDFGWSDIGDWKVVYDIQKKDSNGNVFNGSSETLNINSRNCLVETDSKMVVTIGLENIVIIDTPDALLVCNKDCTQDVKKVVERLKEEGREEYL